MKIESYTQGTPCWADLATTDPAAAKSFYADLFGWTFEDAPMSETMVYTMAVKDGSYVCAMYDQPDDMKQQGMPPFWGVHIAVDDVDEVASRVEACGGTIFHGPFDVFDSGRMVVVSDPSGGMVFLWKGKDHMGAGVKNEPSSIGWCELLSTDPKAAVEFFTSLLGVESETATMPSGEDYTVYMAGGVPVAGTMAMPKQVQEMNVPSHWSVYFDVEDADATFNKAISMGGQAALAPTDIEDVGRLAFVIDPQGAAFGLIAPVPELKDAMTSG